MSSVGIGVIAIIAGIVAIFKLLTSGRGKVSVPGINISWGKWFIHNFSTFNNVVRRYFERGNPLFMVNIFK